MAKSAKARAAASAASAGASAKYGQANRIMADARARGQSDALLQQAKAYVAANGGDLSDAVIAVSRQKPAAAPEPAQPAAQKPQPQQSSAQAPSQASADVPTFEQLESMESAAAPAAAAGPVNNSDLAGRKLPSKSKMIGALTSSGKYTPQEIEGLKKGRIADLGKEYLRYEASVANDPSSTLLPSTPGAPSAAQSTQPVTGGRGKSGSKRSQAAQQRKQNQQAYQSKVQAAAGGPPPTAAAAAPVPAQQAATTAAAAAAAPPPDAEPKPNAYGHRNKPWAVSAAQHIDRNLWNYLTGAAGYTAYRYMFPGEEPPPPQQSGEAGRYDTPFTPEYLRNYQQRWMTPQPPQQPPQQGAPTGAGSLDYPDIAPQQDAPALDAPPPGSGPAGAPPQTTDIIRMLMQRGQV
jgi:hypothetical protein